MKGISRKDLHTIAKHSDIDEEIIHKALQDKVYANKSDWQQFIKILFLSLGIGFTVTGIIFFFAYNWEDLNKFAKLGIIQILIVAGVLFLLFSKSNPQIKNIILTGTSALVGALFAVFGQIYQTGANAYDFFLGWTVFITIWVIVGYYTPLWLMYNILINITLYFYLEQVANNWNDIYISLLFLGINTAILIFFSLIAKYKPQMALQKWYLNILAIASAVFATNTIILLNNSKNYVELLLSIVIVAVIFGLGILQSIASKSILYIALIALSTIISIMYYLIDTMSEVRLLFTGLFSVIAFTIVIKSLLDLQKKWNNGK